LENAFLAIEMEIEMIIFMVGPSGVGKTYLTRQHEKDLNDRIKIRELDHLVEEKSGKKLHEIYAAPDGKEAFWKYAEEVLAELCSQYKDNETICICDCGVGALHTAKGREYFLNSSKTITLLACPWKAFQRKRNKHKGKVNNEDYIDYLKLEFAGLRWEVYSSSNPNIIDIAGLDLDNPKAYEKFKTELQSCIERLAQIQ
jgi:shikimate kinase